MKPDKIAKRLMDLQDLLLRFLEIERMIYLPSNLREDRRENDVEHSYNLALLTWYLCEQYPHLDRDKAIKYALAHDLVEIYAGDVMAVGRTLEQQKEKEIKEAAALSQLDAEWPDFKDLTNTIRVYEQQNDPEAVFVKALDKIAPMLWQIASEGKTWKKFDITRSVVIDLKDEKTAPSVEIANIWQIFKQEILSHDEWFNDGKAD